MTNLRRRLVRLLIRAVFVIDPDPPMTFTTRRLPEEPPPFAPNRDLIGWER